MFKKKIPSTTITPTTTEEEPSISNASAASPTIVDSQKKDGKGGDSQNILNIVLYCIGCGVIVALVFIYLRDLIQWNKFSALIFCMICLCTTREKRPKEKFEQILPVKNVSLELDSTQTMPASKSVKSQPQTSQNQKSAALKTAKR